MDVVHIRALLRPYDSWDIVRYPFGIAMAAT